LNQSVYLTSYFKNINELFNQFGSRNFSLEKSHSKRGHQPVYSLIVKFHGEKISESSFAEVFSESDKRALALAVFWTKIKMMSTEEKSNTILVLDDPAINQFGQVIVLTHYSSFLKVFFEKINRDLTNIKFLEIKKNNQTSSIVDCNIDKFIKSEYQLSYEKITGYINSEHENCIKADLRKFLETSYLSHFFPDRIIQAKKDGIDISTLSSKIDVIFERESDFVRSKFHSFRENTNPDSHIYTSNNTEDVKNFANGMMTFLYSQSFSNN
jgi:wobble nucleotide-excising tRNase